jgi:hypothetical protein
MGTPSGLPKRRAGGRCIRKVSAVVWCTIIHNNLTMPVLGEVGSFEPHGYTSSPSLVLLEDRGRAYLKSCMSKMRDSIPQGSARAGPGERLLRTKVWHHCFRKELHGAHHFVVRHAPKGKVAPKVGDPFLL